MANLRTKESKLAGYLRIDIKRCMDAKTTSPAESQNSLIKSGPSKIASNMNIDKSINRLLKGITNRYNIRLKSACQELAQRNYSSCAPTKDYLIKKGQGLLDAQYDKRMDMKSAQIGVNKFLSWNFDVNLSDYADVAFLNIPKMLRVRQLTVSPSDDGGYILCSCCKSIRYGVPCSCLLKIADNAGITVDKIVDVGMVDVTYTKLFNSSFGLNNDTDQILLQAQKQCFDNEHKGTKVNTEYIHKLCSSSQGQSPSIESPLIGKNTTQDDYEQAMFVLSRFDQKNVLPCVI